MAKTKTRDDAENYWVRREAKAREKSQSDDSDKSDVVKRIFEHMFHSVTEQINAWYSKYASKEGISMAEAKKRADKLDIKAYEEKAKKYVKEKDFSQQANDEMKIYNLTMKANRLELLKSEVALELAAGNDEYEKYVEDCLKDKTIDEMERQAGILGKTIKNNGDMIKSIVNASFYNATFSERIWANQDMLRSELEGYMIKAIIQGKSTTSLISDMRKRFDVSYYAADRLLRTEERRIQTDVAKRSYEENGFSQYKYVVMNTKACDECRKLDGNIYDTKDMTPGVNAPPMHPICHCSTVPYIDRKLFDEYLGDPDSGDMTFEEWKKQKNQEKERINIPDTGKNVPGHVNSRLITTKTYHNKFEGLTSHKAVNESLYNESLQILSDNNDTQYEHIVAIDAKTGERLAKNTSAADNKMILQSGFSKGQNSMLSNESTPLFEAVHNHPNNSIPSRDDIIKLFERPRQISSVIICHNGAVYRLEKLEKYEKVDDLANKIYSFNKKKYIDYSEDKAEYECSMSLIKYLVKKGVMAYEKR